MKSPAVLSAFKKRKQTEEEHQRKLRQRAPHRRRSLRQENQPKLEESAKTQASRPSITEQLVTMWRSMKNSASSFLRILPLGILLTVLIAQ